MNPLRPGRRCRPARGSHEHPLALAGGGPHSEGHVEGAPVAWVEVVERDSEGDAGELAARGGARWSPRRLRICWVLSRRVEAAVGTERGANYSLT